MIWAVNVTIFHGEKSARSGAVSLESPAIFHYAVRRGRRMRRDEGRGQSGGEHPWRVRLLLCATVAGRRRRAFSPLLGARFAGGRFLAIGA